MWVFHVPKDAMMDWRSCPKCFCSFNTNPCSRIEMLHRDPRWHVNPDRHHLYRKPAKNYGEGGGKTQSLCLRVAFKRFGEESQSKFAFILEL